MLTLNAVIQTQRMLNTGHPNLAVVPENTKKFYKIVLAECKLHKIAEKLKISEGSVFTILHEHLSRRKLCSKWVLSIENNALTIQSVVYNYFNATKRSFCINIWQLTKHRSNTLLQSQIGSQLSEQQQVKAIQNDQMQTSAGRVLASIFWNTQGILSLDYLEKGRTINSEYYDIINAFEGRNC